VYGPAHADVQQLRWMIEEFRVSLYAQELKTLQPVSARRLEELLRRAREQGRALGTIGALDPIR
jgi:ATP-dependent helicase HrpA